jgi:hypothetical protein
MNDALKSVEEAFAETTIASLVGEAFCESEKCDAPA